MTMIPWETVQAATRCPGQSVMLHWPLIHDALAALSIAQTPVQIAAAATVAIETAGTFKPIREYASGKAYDTGRLAARLGNTPEADGDGQLYKGRGFIQLTGRANYADYGAALGINLLGDPDLALDPHVSARILARYFRTVGVDQVALRGEWPQVRKKINGGFNHYAEFKVVVDRLLKAGA